jgi:BMFP domain-containing protein YqiC
LLTIVLNRNSGAACGWRAKRRNPASAPRDGEHKKSLWRFALVVGGNRRDAGRIRAGVRALASAAICPHFRGREFSMTQTSNRFFDEAARLMNDAAGVASGVRREFDTMVRQQAERYLRDLEVVQREEFEAVKEMARLAREENEALKARIAALEAKLGGSSAAPETGGG